MGLVGRVEVVPLVAMESREGRVALEHWGASPFHAL